MEQWAMQLIRRAVDSLYRYRLLYFVLGIAIAALSYPISRRLAFDQNIQSLFSINDPRLKQFQFSKERFGGDEFAIVAWTETELFNDDGDLTEDTSERIKNFAEKLSAVPGVQPESTQDLRKALRLKFMRKRLRELVENVLVGEDGKTTAVVLRLKPEKQTKDGKPAATVPRGRTIAGIRKLAKGHDPPAAVVGEPIQVHDMFRIVQKDGTILFLVSLAILGFVIFVLFRRVRWVVLPILAVAATIVCTEALLVISQLRLSMVSSMLNSLVTIIVIATVTHVTVHYRELRANLPPPEAMRTTLVNLAAPVFWTCATTAVGFLALLSSEITPVSSFGLMMGLATMVSFGLFALLLPGGILFGAREGSIPGDAPAEKLLSAGLKGVSTGIERHPFALLIFGFVLMAAALPGLFRLTIETDFSKNFRKSSDIVQSLEFVESRLGGAGIWEINFPAPPIDELDDEFLSEVRDFTKELRGLKDESGEFALKVASLTDGLDLVPRLFFNTEERVRILGNLQGEFVSSLYHSEKQRIRIVLRSREQQRSEEKLKIIERVQEMAQARFAATENEEPPRATGMFVLLTFVIQSLLGDQLVSFGLAAVGISLMMAFAFRSVAIGLLSLIPNVFPIILVIGTMGWIGTPVNIGTAMIASVSMGLTVDSTIHYISAFRRALAEEGNVDAAIRRTHQSVGRALVFAHIALIAGFLVLTLSDFIPLVYFGVLLSLSMVGGLIGDLVMLPILLRWVYGRRMQPLPLERDSAPISD